MSEKTKGRLDVIAEILREVGHLQRENSELKLENKILDSRIYSLEHGNPQPRTFEYTPPGAQQLANQINELKDQEQFSTGAVRRKTDDCALELIPLEALEGYGHRLHYGATVRGYGPRNWEKGIPYANLIQHAQRHLSKFAEQLSHYDKPDFRIEPLKNLEQAYPHGEEGQYDTLYGNACAALWNLAAIVTFLRRGNPAETKP